MKSLPVETSPRRRARIAGVLYLIVIGAGIFAEIFVRNRLFVAGNAAATAHNIVAHELLYRLGFAAELTALVCNIPLVVIFYDLFKVVNKQASLLVVFFSLVGTAIESVSLLNHFAPLLLLGGGSVLTVLSAEQLQALAYTSLQLFERGWAIALVFFGFFCISFGYLILRSTFLPRIFGALYVIGGLCYVINNFAYFLAPAFHARLLPYILLPSGLAEISLTLWFLIIGLNARRWQEQASASMGSIPRESRLESA